MRQGEGNMRALFLVLTLVVLAFPAQSRAEFFWVDANGRVIAPFLTGTYVDDAGLFWVLDPETATVSVLNFNDETLYYTEPGCQGPSYLFAGSHGPRQVFTTGTCSIPRVRPDDLASQEISIASYLYRGISCLPVSGTVRLIP